MVGQRYKAWGESRYQILDTGGNLTPTIFRFTGQRQDSGLGGGEGLYYYGARWYDPALGRFAQPDTIIPQNQGVQAFDRYAYVNNNPIKYNDPSGHCFLVCAAIGAVVGAVVGAATVALPQIIKNVQTGQPLTANIDPSEVGKAALIGAGAGAVIGGTLGVDLAAAGIIGGGASGAAAAGGTAALAETAGAVGTEAAVAVNEVKVISTGLSDAVSSIGETAANTITTIQQYYPPNMGFSEMSKVTTLQPGTLVSRYGSTLGAYLSPAGTPAWARSLPPGTENLSLNIYQVVKPIENVLSGITASWWGKIGGGVQYYIGSPYGQNIQKLLDSKYLVPK